MASRKARLSRQTTPARDSTLTISTPQTVSSPPYGVHTTLLQSPFFEGVTAQKILVIDASTEQTGYALFQLGRLVHYEADNTHTIKSSVPRVLRHYFTKVKSLLALYDPDVLVVEDVVFYSYAHMGTAIALARLSAIPFLVAGTRPVYRCNPSSWKARILGNNHASKAESIAYVQTHYGLVVNDDVADAICIGEMWYIGRDKLT